MMNGRMNYLLVICALSLIGLVGCPDTPTDVVSKDPPPAPPPPPVVVESQTPNGVEPSPATEENAAKVGFGEKGHYESQDYISVTVGSQFRVQERLTLLRITDAMQKYKAVHQSYPKTDEEFFKEVIEANSISLPKLPSGQKFGYDPDLAIETNAVESLTILKPK